VSDFGASMAVCLQNRMELDARRASAAIE
jgi:hypothetical protein